MKHVIQPCLWKSVTCTVVKKHKLASVNVENGLYNLSDFLIPGRMF